MYNNEWNEFDRCVYMNEVRIRNKQKKKKREIIKTKKKEKNICSITFT